MDDLVEAVLELLFEVPFEAAMESRKLKTGVKTTLFCVLGGLIEVMFAFFTVSSWQDNDYTARFVMTIITVAWFLFVIFGAIRGHSRKWKN